MGTELGTLSFVFWKFQPTSQFLYKDLYSVLYLVFYLVLIVQLSVNFF